MPIVIALIAAGVAWWFVSAKSSQNPAPAPAPPTPPAPIAVIDVANKPSGGASAVVLRAVPHAPSSDVAVDGQAPFAQTHAVPNVQNVGDPPPPAINVHTVNPAINSG